MSYKEEYLEILTHGADLAKLCDVFAETVGDPVALVLPTKTIISHSKNYSKQLLDDFSRTIDLFPEINDDQHQASFRKHLMSREPFYDHYPFLSHAYVTCGCFWRGNLLAVVDVPLVNNTNPEALSLTKEAAFVFTTAMLINFGVPTAPVDPMESYMVALLREQVPPEYQQFFSYGFDFDDTPLWQAVWVHPNDPEDRDQILSMLYSFCAGQPSVWCTDWMDGVAVLMDSRELDTFAEQQGALPPAAFVVSEAFPKLSDLPYVTRNLQTVLALAKHVGNVPPVLYEGKYKTLLFYLAAARNAPERSYHSDLISSLQEYEKTHDNGFVQTLRSYLLNNMDLDRIAADMKIHKNTVSYRLKQISELFQIDLKDCGVITELYLALFAEIMEEAKGK